MPHQFLDLLGVMAFLDPQGRTGVAKGVQGIPGDRLGLAILTLAALRKAWLEAPPTPPQADDRMFNIKSATPSRRRSGGVAAAAADGVFEVGLSNGAEIAMNIFAEKSSPHPSPTFRELKPCAAARTCECAKATWLARQRIFKFRSTFSTLSHAAQVNSPMSNCSGSPRSCTPTATSASTPSRITGPPGPGAVQNPDPTIRAAQEAYQAALAGARPPEPVRSPPAPPTPSPWPPKRPGFAA